MGELDKLIVKVNKRYADSSGKPVPIWDNTLNYETHIDNLQPVYFWIVDFANTIYGGSENVEKMYDNFVTSPGSSYFAELGQRATRMQEEGMKIMGMVNTVIKSVLNLIYDLKEFEILFNDYNNANNTTDPKTKETGILALKQRWISTVDAKRGMGSIDNMAHQYGFTLLRPAFMATNSAEAVDKMDLNDIVKRDLKPRLAEFFEWAKLSEIELRKRYNIEKSYLKNQVNTLKLYTEWVKPYLSAAKQLGMSPAGTTPSLVSVFGTMMLNLEILGAKEYSVEDAVVAKDLPLNFRALSEKKQIRKFYQVGVINFGFRTFPTQQSMHSGKVNMEFKSYALNEDELEYLRLLKEDQDKKDIFAVTSITEETLSQLKDDIDKFLKEEDKKVEKEESAFAGLFKGFGKSFFGKEEKKEEPTEASIEKKKSDKFNDYKKNGVRPDTYEESVVRALAEVDAAGLCFKIYDVFKKSKGMAAFVSPFDEPDVMQRIRIKIAEVNSIRKMKEIQEASKQQIKK